MEVLYNASIYKDKDDLILGVFASARDVTELKKASVIQLILNAELEERVRLRTENLATAVESLKRSNQELEQFAYVASHDLQEPLRMISSFAQLLAQEYRGKLDQEADEYIHYVVDGANRMQSLIQDLLSYSRVLSRGKPFEEVDLNQVLGEVHSSLQLLIQENGAAIGHDSLPMIICDASQMSQLFQNLISNSLKFRRDELPLIQISARDEGEFWHFTVSDNGIGIEEQYFERIFKIFQRLHTKAEYPGTGIGLAVCQRIVEKHGGRTWIESEPGKGTTVHFTISKSTSNEIRLDDDNKQ
jgi:light-regulated signal transduction histidine kinase (bacteriophytochrome)